MKRHIRFLACLALATCCVGQVDFVRADEREELKARVAELEYQAKRFAKEGKPDEVVRLNRERSALMAKLIRLQRESQQAAESEEQGRGGTNMTSVICHQNSWRKWNEPNNKSITFESLLNISRWRRNTTWPMN